MVAKKLTVIIVTVLLGFGSIKLYGTAKEEHTEGNVFDQMIENGYPIMADAEHVTVGGYDAIRLIYPIAGEHDMRIGLVYSGQYRKLYIYGEAEPDEGAGGQGYQEWFENCMEEQGISWAAMEDHKEDFICGEILDPWFEEKQGYFSKDRLGDLEIMDYLMPYEYCGMDVEILDEETVEEKYGDLDICKVKYKTYITWSLPLIRKCVQESREYDYSNIMDRIEDDIKGISTVSERFLRWNIPYPEFESVSGSITDWNGLIKYIRYSGRVKGNLTRLAYRREEGEKKTLKMLQHYTPQMIREAMTTGATYYDEDYLYVRFPYCDYQDTEPVWVGNGTGEPWQGWLAMEWDDISRFLINYAEE